VIEGASAAESAESTAGELWSLCRTLFVYTTNPLSPIVLSPSELSSLFTPFDLKRIDSYSNNMLDYHVILDLLPSLASLFFTRRFGPDTSLAAAQQAILLALGLQRKTIEDVERELNIPVNQGLALFVKILRKFSRHLHDLQKKAVGVDVPEQEPTIRRNVAAGEDSATVGTSDWKPMKNTVEEDLEEVVDEETKRARTIQRELIDSMDLTQ
jgi:N-acetyltransferase 10